MQKGSTNVRSFIWLFSKAFGLKFSDKVSSEMFLVTFDFCVFLICFFSDQLFIHQINGKYHSATAPLVIFFLSNFLKIIDIKRFDMVI